MSFDDFTETPGRLASSILELDLDGCARRYGISPCVATLALTNFIRESETFDIGWGLRNATVVANSIANPLNGAVTADEINEDATVGVQHRIDRTSNRNDFDLSVPQTAAYYFKAKDGGRWVSVVLWNGLDVARVWANPDTGAMGTARVTTGVATIIGAGCYAVPNQPGWFRIYITSIIVPGTPTTGVLSIGLQLAQQDGQLTYPGTAGIGIYGFGAQLRTGIRPGRYQVTTSADVDGMGAVDDLCFNTFDTCQDTPNYLKEVRTYRFADVYNQPRALIDAYPSILSVKYGPTRLVPGGGFSVRGRVTVTLQDFAATDVGVDNYAEERTYNAEAQGTFFGRLFSRNRFYEGRPMRVLEGYADKPFDLSNYRTREYIIDQINGPDAMGRVQIIGKDILSLAIDSKSKCPVGSTFTLRAAMTAGQTTLLPQIGEAVLMVAASFDKHIRVDDEIVSITSESPTDTLNVVRGQGGTVGTAHNIDASIQECKTFENVPVIDVIKTLLEDFAKVPTAFIPFTDWQAEETESLSGYDLETIISTPTGVQTLLKEISETTLLDIWYSDVDQEIKLKLQTPFTEVTAADVIDDNKHVIKDSLRIRNMTKDRLSRVLIYYGMKNFARDLKEPENFEFINFEIEADKEGVNKYNDERTKVIFTRWMDKSNKQQIQLTSTRLLLRFSHTPQEISFQVDAKDVTRLETGDVFDFTSRIKQSVDGLPATARFQMIETNALKIASQYQYKALAFFQDPTPTSLTISTNQINYDVFVELGGPPGPVDITLTINTGINVDGQGAPAITTVGLHPDSILRIVNNGNIRGYGGAGANGGGVNNFSEWDAESSSCFYFPQVLPGQSGSLGGDSIDWFGDELTIDNTNGTIFAGSGGGGGGDGFSVGGVSNGGGAGGGGRGTDTGNKGFGGVPIDIDVSPQCQFTNSNGGDGTDGSTSAPGVGGIGPGSAGDGGDGGADWGDDGDVGAFGPGGVGGFAVRLNGGSIVWEGGFTAAKVKGDVA
jgi:hypothetical protein